MNYCREKQSWEQNETIQTKSPRTRERVRESESEREREREDDK